jgi:hypothetical protein
MPHFQASVRCPWTADRAYDYLADLEHFEDWDPGTVRAEQVAPDAYDVTVKTFGREMTLRYEVVEAAPPRHLRLVAQTRTLRLVDEITIEDASAGCVVTYDATLTLKGPLAILSPLFAPGFKRTVDRGAAGLRTALEGVPA